MADRMTDGPGQKAGKEVKGSSGLVLRSLFVVAGALAILAVAVVAVWLLASLSGSSVYPVAPPAPTAYVVGYSEGGFDALNELVAGMWLNGDGSDRITFNRDHTFARYVINASTGNRDYAGQWRVENSRLYVCRLTYDGMEYEEGLEITAMPGGAASGKLIPLCSCPGSPLPARYGYTKYAG